MALTLDSMNLDGWVDPTVEQADELEVDLNLYELGAAAIGAGVVVSSVGICAMAAPTVVVPATAAASGLAYVGYCKRNDLPFNPFDKKDKTKKEDTPVAAVQPVTDTKGNEVEVEGL